MSDKILSFDEMYALAQRLFPICRSLTGDGVRESLRILQEHLPALTLHEVPSGTQAFDWTVPKEWNIRGGYIENEEGDRIVDFAHSNLHIMGYSLPVDAWMTRDELLQHVYVQEDQPDVIPYVTSYYKERFGFCMPKTLRDMLPDGRYHAVIDSTLADGHLTYGEWVLPGDTEDEILLTSYVCHPSMANNELSGPIVAVALAQWLQSLPRRRYTYRVLLVPETIGSIVYISSHLEHLQAHLKAGFVLTCEGDNRAFSYVPTKRGGTLADRAALNALRLHAPNFTAYTFLERGSDERQYNAAGVELPVCSVMRSKYHLFPEYHTSADDLSFISPDGLGGAFELHRHILTALEHNRRYRVTCCCEPQLGKRGLYPTVSSRCSAHAVKTLTDFIAYADGKDDLIAISDRIGVPVSVLIPIVETLMQHGLLAAMD